MREALKNVATLIGPLHLSLNARECVMIVFHEIVADVYTFHFGKTRLPKKPKPWRISLFLEIIYGRWKLIKEDIFSVFH